MMYGRVSLSFFYHTHTDGLVYIASDALSLPFVRLASPKSLKESRCWFDTFGPACQLLIVLECLLFYCL